MEAFWMKKRCISALLALCLTLALLPAVTLPARAANPLSTHVNINGISIGSGDKLFLLKNGSTSETGTLGVDAMAHFDPATGTVTLHDYTGRWIEEASLGSGARNLTIKLVGNNTLENLITHGIRNYSGGDIIITADTNATLNITIPRDAGTSSGNGAVGITTAYIAPVGSKRIILKGRATVNINVASENHFAYGAYSGNTIDILENASLSVTCIAPAGMNQGASALFCVGRLTINTTGNVTLDCSDPSNGFGMPIISTGGTPVLENADTFTRKWNNSRGYEPVYDTGKFVASGSHDDSISIISRGTLPVTLTSGSSRITVTPPPADPSYRYYYTTSATPMAAPMSSAYIGGQQQLNGPVVIPATNGTPLYVQVYKVDTMQNYHIVSFGEGIAVPCDGAPAAPTELSAVPSSTRVDLRWKAPDDDGGSAITRYEVSYSSDSYNSGWLTISGTESHSVTGLTNGTLYTFNVRAVNAYGNGLPSAAATARPYAAALTSVSVGATQLGGEQGEADTTALRLGFFPQITGLQLSHIFLLSETGAVVKGSSLVQDPEDPQWWTLSLDSVRRPGYIMVAVEGFSGYFFPETAQVWVYKETTEFSTISLTVVPPVGGTVPNYDGAFVPLADTDKYTAIVMGWYQKSNNNYLPPGQPFVAGEEYYVWVSVEAKNGYQAAENVTALINGHPPTQLTSSTSFRQEFTAILPGKIPVQFTATQIGGASGTAYSTGISIEFDTVISGLKAEHVTVRDIFGSVRVGALSESTTSAGWTLTLDSVLAEDTIYVSVASFGEYGVTTAELPVTVYKSDATSTLIDSVSLTVPVQAVGGNPDCSVVVAAADAHKYAVLDMSWLSADGSYMTSADTFAAGDEYYARILLYPKSGYAFPDGAAPLAATVNGVAAQNLSSHSATAANVFSAHFFPVEPGKTPVTFTAQQTSGAPDTAYSNGIRFTFDQPVSGLSAADIEVWDRSGMVRTGALLGADGDSVWTLALDSVERQGTVDVTVASFGAFGVTTVYQAVEVYKNNADPVNIAAIAVTLTPPVHGAKPDYTAVVDSTHTDQYIAEVLSWFYRSGEKNGTVMEPTDEFVGGEVYSAYAQMYAKSGYAFAAGASATLQGEPFTLGYAGWTAIGEVYLTAGWGDKTPVTFTAEEVGGTQNTLPSTAIVLTFSEPVEGLFGTDITITNGSGSATGGVLEMVDSGTTWRLPLNTIDKQGTVKVTIANFGDFVVTGGAQTVMIYQYTTGVTVSGQVKSYYSITEITLTLSDKDSGASYIATTNGGGVALPVAAAEFIFDDLIPEGEYTLTVAKLGHGTREYDVTVYEDMDPLDYLEIFSIGDVNMSGMVNSSDVTWLRQLIVEAIELADCDPYQLLLADINGINGINSSDVTLLRQRVVEMLDEYYQAK